VPGLLIHDDRTPANFEREHGGIGLQGIRHRPGIRWARNESSASLAYITVMLAALVVDHR